MLYEPQPTFCNTCYNWKSNLNFHVIEIFVGFKLVSILYNETDEQFKENMKK